MVKVSAIIVSDARKKILDDMTSEMIKSLKSNEKHLEIEVIIVEKNKHYNCDYKKYLSNDDMILRQPEVFTYNGSLNIGIEKATGTHIALLNNDIMFPNKHTFSRMISEMQKNDLDIVSPIGHDVEKIKDKLHLDFIEGFEVRKNLFGFFIFGKSDTIKALYPLSTEWSFWGSEDCIIDTAKDRGWRIASLPQIKVIHHESVSLKNETRKKQIEYTKYKKKKNVN